MQHEWCLYHSMGNTSQTYQLDCVINHVISCLGIKLLSRAIKWLLCLLSIAPVESPCLEYHIVVVLFDWHLFPLTIRCVTFVPSDYSFLAIDDMWYHLIYKNRRHEKYDHSGFNATLIGGNKMHINITLNGTFLLFNIDISHDVRRHACTDFFNNTIGSALLFEHSKPIFGWCITTARYFTNIAIPPLFSKHSRNRGLLFP